MSKDDDDTEKTFEPTAHKLAEARRKGDVPKSQDLNAAAAFFGLFLAVSFIDGALVSAVQSMMMFLDRPDELVDLFFEGQATAPTAQAFDPMLNLLVLLFGLPPLLVVVSLVAQRGITFAPMKIAPKLSNISPLSIAKQKFGISGLFEFFKSFVKLLIYAVCMFILIYIEIPRLLAIPYWDSYQFLIYLGYLISTFIFILVLVSGVVGPVDFFFQSFEHRRKLRMSRKEVQDESKHNEGDQNLKQERQSRGRTRALSQSINDVADADVVITNPTHYAVALQWSREPGSAPICVAKGVDEIARVIRERALEHQIPIREDPPTSRALYATTEVGDEIPPDLYRAVATAIQFAEAMRQKARQRG